MFEFAIRNPIIISVAILIVCLFGILAVFRVPVQMIPDLDVRVVSVETSWPGATPQDVEKEIIIEQEDYLRSIPGLERMISKASMGRAEVELEFPLGTDINEVLIRVNNALSQVPSYPENVDEPRILTSSFSSNAFMYFSITPLEANPKQVDIVTMRDFVDDHVRTPLERVPGVSEVGLSGGAERQIKLYVDPAKLAEREITIQELRQAIRSRNRDVSGGDLDSGKRRYLVRTIGRFETLEDIESTIIARRGEALIRLSDVGYAELDHSELRSYSQVNGEPRIGLSIRRQVGANVIDIRDDVMAATDELNAGILKRAGLKMRLSSEDVRYVEGAIAVVRQNLLIGAVLATLVLFLFLRSWPATLVGAIGIPVCAVAAFLGLLITGRTINVISLAGVAFAIGMTLDNSIVVLENIYRHLAEGKSRVRAALDGVREVWPAVLASTLTTVFVFIPIIFVKQEAGQLYSDIAIAISASILMSMLVAITIIPTACRHFLRADSIEAIGKLRPGLHGVGQRSGQAIMNLLTWLLSSIGRRTSAIVLVVLLSAGIILVLTPKAEYLPEGEEKKAFALLFAPPGYNIEEMREAMQELGDFLVPHLHEDPVLFDRGEREVPALDSVFQSASVSSVFNVVETTEWSHIDDLVRVLSKRFAEIPGMLGFVSRGSIFASNLGGTRSINLDITGNRLVPLYEAAFEAFVKSKEVFENPQVRPDPSSLSMGQLMLEVRPDWERAAELGFESDELGYMIWAFSDGAFIDEFFLDDDKIDMFIYSTTGTIERPGDLDQLLIYSPAGGIIPLSAAARIQETVNTDIIRRVDGERTITLSIIPPRDVPLEAGVEIVERDVIATLEASGNIGEDVNMRISGASDLLVATRDALTANFLVAVLISYLLMVAILSHWGFPLVIMTTVPIGISFGILGLWLLNAIGGFLEAMGFGGFLQPFDMITMMGFLILIGTVVNNPILIVEKTMQNLRIRGMTNVEAVVEATRSRLRPVVMSTITTVCGLSPLVLLPGPGTELYRGLGAIVLFGLLFSAAVTLTFLPALLSLILELRDFLGEKREKTRTATDAAR